MNTNLVIPFPTREKTTPGNRAVRRVSLLLLAGLALVAGCSSYQPLRSVDQQLPDGVLIQDTGDYILVEDNDETASNGIIFYPGGLVAPEAYVSMLAPLAAQGVPVAIVRVRFDLAVFDMEKARTVLNGADSEKAQEWFVAGHSLGGAMGARFVARLGDEFPKVAGLILLAAYPADNDSLAESDYPILAIWASEDGLATEEDRRQSRELLPGRTTVKVIQGGNHAQFGEYGPQDGDGEAEISREEQHRQIRESILEFLRNR
jgi:dienelactone hydrolase